MIAILSFLSKAWESFFHSRTTINGCRIAGYIRIGFIILFLIDRIFLIKDLDYFFSPQRGILPYRVTRNNYELKDYNRWSVFQLAPESNTLIWIVHGVGIIQGLILLIGITKFPRLHLLGLYINMLSFHNHNVMIWDGEDSMFRIWCFLLFFFPLHHCTIYDGWGRHISSKTAASSVMYPFRIFQIELVLIYMGASLGKLAEEFWKDGSAIYRLTYGIDDYPGIFNPYIIFASYGPLKVLCWSALILESTCYWTVWVPALRKISVILMILLHIGIDLSMNMHMFEWLSCIGWTVFLIQPTDNINVDTDPNDDDDDDDNTNNDGNNDGIRNDNGNGNENINPDNNASVSDNRSENGNDNGHDNENENESDQTKTTGSSNPKPKSRMIYVFTSFRKAMINVFIASFLLLLSFDAMPFEYFTKFAPKQYTPYFKRFAVRREEFYSEYLDTFLSHLGISQGGDWSMYTNVVVSRTSYRIDAVLNDGTKVANVWRSPEWSSMSNWERKRASRRTNYFNDIEESLDELFHLIEVMTKPFIEQDHVVETLTFVAEYEDHKIHDMKSSGGWFDPVIVHPMDILSEFDILVLRVECQDEIPTDKCTQLINEQGGCSTNNGDTTLLLRCRRSCFECNDSHQVVYWHNADADDVGVDTNKEDDNINNENNNGEGEHDDVVVDDDDDDDYMEEEKDDTNEEEGKKKNGGPGGSHEYEEL